MIVLNKVSKSFGNRVIFDQVDLHLNKKKSIYCILGESGCGKTTLFQMLFGLDFDFTGEYKLNGKNVKEMTTLEWDSARSNFIQIVFQDFNLLEHLSVYNNLLYSLNENTKSNMERIDDLLEIMDLSKIKNNTVSKLSGGEKQRLALARAVVNKPEIILLDEPTGNLDDKNAEKVMRYINKLKDDNVMVLIITHDARVLSYCDYSLKIENKKIVSDTNNEIFESAIYKPTKIEKKKVSILKYTLISLKSNVLDVVFANIPIATIFVIFLCLFNVLYSISIDSMNTFFNGIKEDAIYLSTTNYTDAYINASSNDNITPIDDGTRIGFSKEDVSKLEAISGVEEVVLFNGSVTDSFDRDGNNLSIQMRKENFPDTLKESSSYTNAPERISFSFASLNVPSSVIPYYNPKNIVLIEGNFPQVGTNELLLPDLYLDYLLQNKVIPSTKEVLGQSIALDVILEDGTSGVKSYVIAGYYQTDYSSNIQGEYYLYLPYVQYDFLDLFLTNEQYLSYRNHYLSVNENVNIEESLYKDYTTYSKAIGTNLCDLVIITNPKYSQEKINEEVSKVFPNLNQVSQFEFMHGSYRDTYNRVIFKITALMVGVSIVFGIVIVFINKNYIKRRNKEMAILYSLGYSRAQVLRIVISEYIITTIIDFALAIIVIWLLYTIYFKYQHYGIQVSDFLDVQKLMQSFLFILLITLISILFSIVGIKKNKLKKYLR